jgi:hypothetical protein
MLDVATRDFFPPRLIKEGNCVCRSAVSHSWPSWVEVFGIDVVQVRLESNGYVDVRG